MQQKDNPSEGKIRQCTGSKPLLFWLSLPLIMTGAYFSKAFIFLNSCADVRHYSNPATRESGFKIH